MKPSISQLKQLLLNMLFLQDSNTRLDSSPLDEHDWMNLHAMVRDHRLGALLHWRLSQVQPAMLAPDELREFCAQSFHYWTMRALMLQRELLQAHRILKVAGIPHLALKGSWLAFHAYPHPGLRPMRDLDILVQKQDAFGAFQALLDGGFTRFEKYDGDIEAYAKEHKHLPPLRSPSCQITVELHLRLYGQNRDSLNQFELSEEPDIWQGFISEKILGESISYLPPTELLLHLIVHAVYDHRFNNGPLIISDMGYLLRQRPIDWPRFWELAGRGGHIKGAILALRLLERFWGAQPIKWPDDNEVSLQMQNMPLDGAAQLMLRNCRAIGSVNVCEEIQGQVSPIGKLVYLLRKIFPRRSLIAASYPVSEHSPLIYVWYPVRWWRLLNKTLPAFLRAQKKGYIKTEVSQLSQLNAWLDQVAG